MMKYKGYEDTPMFKILAFLVILALSAIACGDGPEAPIVELDVSLEVIEAHGSDPLVIRAHIQNVGNIKTVSRGGCWLVEFSLSDADGNPKMIMDPCMLAVIRCGEVVVELFPRQHHEADLPVDGIVYEMNHEEENGNAYFSCEEVPMDPGDYIASASVTYRTDDMLPEEPSLVATASTTFNWNP
jgi:hypothetical protein